MAQQRLTFAMMASAEAVHMNGFGSSLCAMRNSLIAPMSTGTFRKTPRLRRFWAGGDSRAARRGSRPLAVGGHGDQLRSDGVIPLLLARPGIRFSADACRSCGESPRVAGLRCAAGAAAAILAADRRRGSRMASRTRSCHGSTYVLEVVGARGIGPAPTTFWRPSASLGVIHRRH